MSCKTPVIEASLSLCLACSISSFGTLRSPAHTPARATVLFPNSCQTTLTTEDRAPKGSQESVSPSPSPAPRSPPLGQLGKLSGPSPSLHWCQHQRAADPLYFLKAKQSFQSFPVGWGLPTGRLEGASASLGATTPWYLPFSEPHTTSEGGTGIAFTNPLLCIGHFALVSAASPNPERILSLPRTDEDKQVPRCFLQSHKMEGTEQNVNLTFSHLRMVVGVDCIPHGHFLSLYIARLLE